MRDERQRGFTLIEIAIVVLVIAVMAGMAIPLISNYMKNYRLGMAAQDMASALQRAKYTATSNNTIAGIRIKENSMVDIIQYDPLGVADPKKVGLIVLPTDAYVDASAPTEIDFDGRGVLSPLPAESPVIRVNGVNGYYSNVTISPTGQVTVSGMLSQ